MTSSPAGGFFFRNSSRARRLARFLTTAEPSFRVAATPNRHWLLLFCATNRVMNRPRNRRPCSYARSNSGRRRTRSCRERRSVTGRCLSLSLVRDGQTFPALRAATLQHDAAVLCCHPHAEAVSLAAATSVGLKRALTLSHCACVLHELGVESSSRETPNTSRRLSIVSKRKPIVSGVLQFAGVSQGVPSCAVTAVHSVSPPRFPHLWKTLWKSR
jgi:hypothetical protein